MEGFLVFDNVKERLLTKKTLKRYFKQNNIQIATFKKVINCVKYNKQNPNSNQYKLSNDKHTGLRKSLDQNKDLKIDKVKKCCRKHCFGEYSRDFISEEQFKQFYVANNFSNTCSGCDTYFFRINQFTYGKNYPLDKIKVGRFDLYRNDKLRGTQEDELESKKIVRSLKGFKKYFKTKNLKKREKFFKKKNPSLIKGYTISERNLISDLWVSLKKNNEHKPSDLKEEELKNCIDKLPITHYCHCCKKNNLYHKYRNKIKKEKKTFTLRCLQQSTI